MKIALIDLFCGAGGTTTGIEKATYLGNKIAKVIACVNHDEVAIQSHSANHKGVLHFTEDIRTLDLTKLIALVEKYRAMGYTIALWASLECTNFSNAKGGLPRDADSRTLAIDLYRYIDDLKPSYIFIENVIEFMSWGALDKKGKPVSKDKGTDYLKWITSIQKKQYRYEYAILNSADYGARTKRKRYFGVFAKQGLPIAFPEATHAKKPDTGLTLFGNNLKKWLPMRPFLKLDVLGTSIFFRKSGKPLSEKTLERIYAGLIKFVAGGKDNFMIKFNSVNQKTGKTVPPNIDEPCPAITTQNRLALVNCQHFIAKYYSGRPEGKVVSIEEPGATITCSDHQSIVSAEFIAAYYGTGNNCSNVNSPSPTITTKDRLTVVQPQFISRDFSNGANVQDIDAPSGSITAVPKLNLVTAETLNSNTKKHYLINPQWFNTSSQSIDEPCYTLIARMDKAPPYIVSTEQGYVAIEVYSTDSPMTVKIKEFMAMYGIIDIKMRMLMVDELKAIQGFPANYILKGNQAQQKKFIGNSVVPLMAKLIIKANYKALLEYSQTKKAA